MRIGNIRRRVAPVFVVGLLGPAVPLPAFAQDAMQSCIQQGFKPGSSGFYRCLQQSGGTDRPTTEKKQESGDAGSILGGSSDNAVTDYSGSSMEGASAPDPDLLKQLNSGSTPKR
ncbi:MAG: hypothetical protein AAF942_06135 [Pseudomonadota bacterium]